MAIQRITVCCALTLALCLLAFKPVVFVSAEDQHVEIKLPPGANVGEQQAEKVPSPDENKPDPGVLEAANVPAPPKDVAVVAVADTPGDKKDNAAENPPGAGEDHHDEDPYAGLNEKEIKRVKAKKRMEEFQKKHKGHERMHMEIFLTLVLTAMLFSGVLSYWRARHFSSFQLVTTICLWLIPLYFSIELHFDRMLFLWTTYTVCTAFVTFKATRKPLAQHTPRRVYTYFTVLYKLSIFAIYVGYLYITAEVLTNGAISKLFGFHRKSAVGMVTMFYGLYFGALTRDFAQVASSAMASVIGYYNKDGIPAKTLNDDVCAICGERLEKDDAAEKVVTLDCKHRFHEFCLRGWCLVGKKDTCPYCNEKVRLKSIYQPWSLQRQDVLFSELLDLIEYMVVWMPMIMVVANIFTLMFGLH